MSVRPSLASAASGISPKNASPGAGVFGSAKAAQIPDNDCRPTTANPFMDSCGKAIEIKPESAAAGLTAYREITPGYRISSGDCMTVEFVGDLFYTSSYCVANSGNLFKGGGKDAALEVNKDYFTFVVETPAVGLTVEEFHKKLSAKASNIFKNKFTVSVSMTDIKPFTVNVLGGVRNPGLYKVDGATRLSGAIAAAGGIQETSSIRTISVARGNAPAKTVDLYKFFLNEDPSQNIYLQANDTIFVGRTNRIVTMTGRFHSPGRYELLPGEDAGALFRFAQGADEEADLSELDVTIKNSNGEYSVRTVSLNEAGAIDGATVAAIYLPSEKKIGGYIYAVLGEDGILPVYTSSPMTLGQLIGGRIPPERYSTLDLSNIVVTRAASESRAAAQVTSSYDLAANDALIDQILLYPGDTVFLTDIGSDVFITGAVKVPGAVKYKTGLTINDYLYMAGGPNENAKLASVRIQRKRNTPGQNTEFIINAKDQASASVPVLPGDIIYVPVRSRQTLLTVINEIFTMNALLSIFNK